MNVDSTMALIAEQAFQLFLLKEQLKEVERINRRINMQNAALKDESTLLKEVVNNFTDKNSEIEELKAENQNLTNALSDAMDWIKETQKERQVKEKCETSKKLIKETASKEIIDAAEKIRKEKFGVYLSPDADVKGKLVINTADSAFISGFLEGSKYQKEKDNEFYVTAANSLDTSTVNRVEVIDSNGRVYVNRNAKNVVVKRQDDFRTLKVFLT